MIAKNTVFLNADKTKAVAEGDKDARFLLVRAGQEISEQVAAKYPGAAEMIDAEPTKEPAKTKQAPPAGDAGPKLHRRHQG